MTFAAAGPSKQKSAVVTSVASDPTEIPIRLLTSDLMGAVCKFSDAWSILMNGNGLTTADKHHNELMKEVAGDMKWNVQMSLPNSPSKFWHLRLVEELATAQSILSGLLDAMVDIQEHHRSLSIRVYKQAVQPKPEGGYRAGAGLDIYRAVSTWTEMSYEEYVSMVQSRGDAVSLSESEYDIIRSASFYDEQRVSAAKYCIYNVLKLGFDSSELCYISKKAKVVMLMARYAGGVNTSVSKKVLNDTIVKLVGSSVIEALERYKVESARIIVHISDNPMDRSRFFDSANSDKWGAAVANCHAFLITMKRLMEETPAMEWVSSGMALFTQLPLGVIRDICVHNRPGPDVKPLQAFIRGMPKIWSIVNLNDLLDPPLPNVSRPYVFDRPADKKKIVGPGFLFVRSTPNVFDTQVGGDSSAARRLLHSETNSDYYSENSFYSLSSYFTFQSAIIEDLGLQPVSLFESNWFLNPNPKVPISSIKIVFSGCSFWTPVPKEQNNPLITQFAEDYHLYVEESVVPEENPLREITCDLFRCTLNYSENGILESNKLTDLITMDEDPWGLEVPKFNQTSIGPSEFAIYLSEAGWTEKNCDKSHGV